MRRVGQSLFFDEDEHAFWRDGARMTRVLSVTQVLRACGLSGRHWTDAARERGVRVHYALYLLNRVSEREAREGLLASDEPFFDAGVQAIRNFGIEVIAAEELVDGETYAGWLDLRANLRRESRPFVIDFKSGSPSATAALQLEAYARPQKDEHGRAQIVLLPNGEPRLKVVEESFSVRQQWRACLTVAALQRSLELEAS